MRILIADDNRDAADTLAIALEVCGHRACAVYDGAQALQRAREFCPDVVILDIHMPQMNGFDTARAFRKQEGRHVLLVAVTAAPHSRTGEMARASGFDLQVGKPFDPFELERVVLAALR